MNLFLDSANIEEIKKFTQYGIISGITTNPSSVSKTQKNFQELIEEICSFFTGEVSVEVVATDFEKMIVEGEKLVDLSDNIVLKIPMTWDGIKACNYLSESCSINMTLCFSATQALVAAQAGASYVSAFLGRLDDISYDGIQLIKDTKQVFSNYPTISTKIIAASIRNVYQVYQSAKVGVDIITVPSNILCKLLDHPLTDKGIQIFLNDWNNSKMQI